MNAEALALEHMAYMGGSLRHKLQAHQLEDYDAFRAWNEERQQPGYRAHIKELDALFDNMWVDECGRRHGKTVKWLFTDYEEMIQRPGCRGLIATPLEESIGGIIVPLIKLLFADCPEAYFPKFVTSHGADGKGLYIKATDSFCKLIGLDKHPDKTRGQFLDFAHITEAAFVNGLEELITGVINPQFRHRPWAWCALESSTAKAPDHDFNRVFREDAKLRGAYRMHTIRDNTSLSEEEIEQEERRSGGKHSSTCRRELYCEEVRDEETMIVPEFDAPSKERPFTLHVVDPRDWVMPAYAMGHVGYDPGTTDPHGQVGLYFDWLAQIIVVQWAWAQSNASTGEVVSRTQNYESKYWGTAHNNATWTPICKECGGMRCAACNMTGVARKPPHERELSLRDAVKTGDGKVWLPANDTLSYWDPGEYTLKPNPYSRISDIDNQFVLDLNVDYGMNLRRANKSPGSKDADTEHLRTLFSARPVKIVILANGDTEPLIMQLRSGQWNTDENGHRTDWKRTKALGHCDCIAALKYVVRDVLWQRNPNKPAHVDPRERDYHVPDEIRDAARGKVTEAYGGRGKHGFVRPLRRASGR